MALDRFRHHKKSPDYVYLSLAFGLILFGFVMIASSSVVLSQANFSQNYGYVIRQLIAFGLGLLGVSLALRLPYQKWRRWALPFFVASLVLLALVLIPGLGKESRGAVRWINLGLFQLQPSEIVKLASIVYFSAWLERRQAVMNRLSTLVAFMALLAPVVALMVLQRDLGTLIVILATLGLLYFMAGASLVQIGLGAAGGLALVAGLIILEPYRVARLAAFRSGANDTLGAGYHINQAFLAIGTGGWWGRGFGKSLQKYLYLPEPHTDSIFAIIVEELGFIRSALVLAVIVALAYRGFRIANGAPDLFGRFLAFGLTAMLLVQAMINLAAIVGLIPLTGVPLPLISYGGTSLVSSLFAVGLIANISRYRYGA